MADKKKEENKVEPPIKDNGDGVLTSKEILEQLRAEEREGHKRTPEEKVHGVLGMVMRDSEGRFLPQEHADELLMALILNPNNAHMVEQGTARKLEYLFDKYKEFAKGPEFEGAIADFKKSIDASPKNEKTTVEMADLDSLEKYLRTENKTFPNGVKIDPADVTEIMAHFIPQPTVISPQKEPQDKKPSSGQAI